MKKIALLLAVIMVLGTVFLAACGNKGTNNHDATTTEPTVGVTTTEAPRVTPPVADDDDDDDDDDVAEPFADASRFTVDGAFGEGEWDGIKTVEVKGVEDDTNHNSNNKRATFYAAMTENGLYLACDAYHDEYTSGNTAGWWYNSNFEFFIGSGSNQYFVYADGMENPCLKSNNVDEAAMVTVIDGTGTLYHTITEAFISNDNLFSDIMYLNTYSIGVAWKTIGDLIYGGAGTAVDNKYDEYWVPLGTWPNNPSLVAAPSGLYLGDNYWEE